MIENSMQWIFGLAVAVLPITIAGFVTSRNLPPQQRKTRIRKFAAIALAIFAFGAPIFSPFVSSFTGTKYLNELKAEELNSTEDIARLEKEQAQQIEQLKAEVEELRADLYAVNNYYKALMQFFAMAIGAAALSFAFRKRKSEDQGLEEVQRN